MNRELPNNDVKNNAAYMILKIGELYKGEPGKKALQKLVFLVQQKGVDLGYDYGIHFYGPYSSALDAEAISLCMDSVVDIDYSDFTHKLRVNKRYTVASTLTPEDEQTICEVIRRYENNTPAKLELLTTAIYAYLYMPGKSHAGVMASVKKIKGEKFSDDQIAEALREFAYFDIALSE